LINDDQSLPCSLLLGSFIEIFFSYCVKTKIFEKSVRGKQGVYIFDYKFSQLRYLTSYHIPMVYAPKKFKKNGFGGGLLLQKNMSLIKKSKQAYSNVKISNDIIKISNIIQNKTYCINSYVLNLYKKAFETGFEKILITLGLPTLNQLEELKREIQQILNSNEYTRIIKIKDDANTKFKKHKNQINESNLSKNEIINYISKFSNNKTKVELEQIDLDKLKKIYLKTYYLKEILPEIQNNQGLINELNQKKIYHVKLLNQLLTYNRNINVANIYEHQNI